MSPRALSQKKCVFLSALCLVFAFTAKSALNIFILVILPYVTATMGRCDCKALAVDTGGV